MSNAIATFAPEHTETLPPLSKNNEIIHKLFAEKLSYIMFGKSLSTIDDSTVPEKGSLAYAACTKKFPSGRYNYTLPKDSYAYFEGTPIVYLLRGPYKSENDSPTGLEYFRAKGIAPVIDILNSHLNPLNIYVQDKQTKTGGFLYFIWNLEEYTANNEAYFARKQEAREKKEAK